MEKEPLKKVAVIVVNWERPADTLECLESVIHSDLEGLNIRIILVDNGSRDDSIPRIAARFPTITIVPLPRNLGFAGGFNAGINRGLDTDNELFLILNNDTTLQKDAIKLLCSAAWDISVPKILFYNQPHRLYAAGARWRLFPPSVVMIGYRRRITQRHQRPGPLEYATGCAFLAKRKVFECVPGFDSDFENYLEDYDFFYRTNRANFSLGYVPESLVYHKSAQSLGEFSPRRWHFLGRNTVLFYRKEDRFPGWALWSQVSWFIMRECVKGNFSLMVPYARGVAEGFRMVGDRRRLFRKAGG